MKEKYEYTLLMRRFCLKDCVIIIPIYHPDRKWNECLRMLKKQKGVEFDLYIVDSGSQLPDYEKDLEGLPYHIEKTTPQEFNHGGTREAARLACASYPILVYMTQDAIPADEDAIRNLIGTFRDPRVAAAYGRQLPHRDATLLAARARAFNYPAESRKKMMADAKELGIKTAFISDTFAAYRAEALAEIGGFPKNVILSEDMYVVAKLVLAGYANQYCAEAKVYHSHNYTMAEEFRRYFDTGAFQAMEPWIRETFGQAEGEGIRFVLAELKWLLCHKPFLLPSAILRDGCKFVGYKMGLQYQKWPLSVRRRCSMMKGYWRQ